MFKFLSSLKLSFKKSGELDQEKFSYWFKMAKRMSPKHREEILKSDLKIAKRAIKSILLTQKKSLTRR